MSVLLCICALVGLLNTALHNSRYWPWEIDAVVCACAIVALALAAGGVIA